MEKTDPSRDVIQRKKKERRLKLIKEKISRLIEEREKLTLELEAINSEYRDRIKALKTLTVELTNEYRELHLKEP